MQGQNERSFPVAQQWQNGKLVVVAPDNLKTGDPVMVPLQTWDKR
jgi:branched-chain amino acid transport system substrate-binding protein